MRLKDAPPLDPTKPLLLLHSASKQVSVAVFESFDKKTGAPVWKTALYSVESIQFPGPLLGSTQVIERKLPYLIDLLDTQSQLTEMLTLLKEASSFIEQRKRQMKLNIKRALKNEVAKREKRARGILKAPNKRTERLLNED